ncbi:MAG: hypothetical protein KI785_14225 [Devosiaceae bacterium]|nr:hypothetical protein [Devosiaceae bacterium MH13]
MTGHSSAPSRRMVLRGLLGLSGLALAGCQVRPLYAPSSAPSATWTGSAIADLFSAITIDPPADRTTQLVRNELVFGLGLSGEPVNPRYRLALAANRTSRALAVQPSGSALTRNVAVTADYQLIPLGERDVLVTNRVTAAASYDAVDQRFANERAQIDAEQRAAREVAMIIQAQLAAALAPGL